MYRLNLPPPGECTSYVIFSCEQESVIENAVRLSLHVSVRKSQVEIVICCQFSDIWLKLENLLPFSWEQESVAKNVACLLKSTKIYPNPPKFSKICFTFFVAGKRGGECSSFVSAFTAIVCPSKALLAKYLPKSAMIHRNPSKWT